MLRSIIFAFCCLGFVSGANGEESVEKACFHVEGMTCATCSLTLKTSVKKLDGVKSVKASVEKKSAEVIFDPNTLSVAKIQKQINSVGYEAKPSKCE